MARITNSNVYPNDAEITGQDKWIGTDAATNTVKNFTVEDVARYLAQSGAADPSRLAFTFDYAGDYVSGQILQNGQFTYELQSGMIPSPAAVNYIRVSAETNVGTNVAGIIPVLLNSLLKLTDNLNPFSNDYSFYEVQGYETITEGGLTTYRIQVNFVSNAASRSRLITNSIALTPFGYQSVESVVIPSGDTNILSGINDPNSAVASATVGSFYIRYDGTAENPVNLRIYGPYTASGGWGTPITLKGDKGDTGAPGPTGPSGANGRNGINGVDGRDGVDGTNGRDGVDGTPGRGWTSGSYDSSTGVVTFNSNDGLGFSTTDLRGQDGNDGADGRDGRDGQDGAPGTDGSDGTDGVNGAQGVQGAYFIEAYADQATAPTQAPTSGSGTVNANSAQLTAAPTTTESGVTYLTSVPASVTNTLYITRSVYNPADNSIGAWSVPFAAATGAAGPQGPPGAQGAAGTNGADGATGPRGRGWTGGSYDTSTGIVTFTSTDGLGFSTGDLRGADGNDGNDGAAGSDGSDGNDGAGWTGGSYNSTTGVVTFTSSDGLGFSTGDLRGADGADGAPGQDGADGNDGTNGTNGRDGVDGADGENGESITVVTQEANDADGNARVSFGTETTSVINTITIPKGPTGDAGTDGDDLSATITNTPASGDTPASNTVIISTNGTETGRFTVSDGAAGAPGAQGERGPNILDATTGVTTTGDNAFTSDRIPEGETNQYYTDAKADARVSAGVLDWAETGNNDNVPNTKLPFSATALPSISSGDAGKAPIVNSSESGYELEDVVTQNADNNLQLGGTELTTDSLEPSSTRPYATNSAVRNAIGIDPDGRADIFLNQTGGFSTANVSDDRIDTRIETVVEDWAVKVENAVGNFISDNTATIPEAKLPDGTLVDRVQFNLLPSESNTHQVPNQVLTANRTWATGDQATVVGTDGTQRNFVYVGETQSRITNTGDNDWREIGGGIDIYETGDSDSPVFDVSAIRFASEGFNISTETYSPDAGNRSGVTKTRLVVSLAGGSTTTGSVDITTFEVSSGFSSTAFGSTSQTPVFRIAGTVSASTYTSLSGTIRTGGASGTVVATIPTTTLTSTSFDIRQALAAATTYEVSRTYTVVINVSDGSGSTITDNVNLTIGPSSPGRPSVTPAAASSLGHTTTGQFSLNEVEQFDTGSITYTFNFPDPGSWQLASVTVEDQDGDSISPNESVTFPQTGPVTLSYTLNVAATDENPSITWSTTYNNPSNTSEMLTNPPSGAVNRTSIRSFRIGEATSEPTITSLMDLDNSDFTIRFGQKNPSGTQTFTTNGGQTLYFVQDSAETQYTSITDNGIDITSDFSTYYLDLDGTRRTSAASTSIFRIYESNVPQPTGIDYTGNYTFS